MGTNDLVKELRAAMVPGRAPLLPHLALALAGARLAGKVILDGVYNDVKDAEGFRAECLQGMQLGFDGKTLIHPSQVETANEVWAPSEDEIAHARKVIEAFEEAERDKRGVVTVDGRMVENLHRDIALRVLATASAIDSAIASRG
jgi:citrate lyase subunit beta/citryl-CoA lyase